MKHNALNAFMAALLTAILSWMPVTSLQAQTVDTLDVLHYDLRLDVGHLQPNTLQGVARLDVALLTPSNSVRLDLSQATVDSVLLEGEGAASFTYDGRHLLVNVGSRHAGDLLTLAVHYRTPGYVESYGWGGFHFNSQIHYNLGVAFSETPHGIGRAWFPCHDSFTDKATYTCTYTAPVGWTTTASGLRDTAYLNPDGSETSVWTLSHATPTYLISLSCGPFHYLRTLTQGLHGTYPTTIAYGTQDSSAVARAFAQLVAVVPMYERCFGPYRWGTIGYTGTPQGSMEHVNNISLANSAMTSMSEEMQSMVAHELSHAWFGNLVTCASSLDMWINEGGASFCEEVAWEALKGKAGADDFYLRSIESVLRTTHISDNGYRPLYGPSMEYTYGNTIYKKGAMVWHSLRGYLGDSLFYASMQRLFSSAAFGNLDSWQLRDSLSLYSGMDLTGFFDLHVFRPGFVDYLIDDFHTEWQADGWHTTIALRQQLAHCDSTAPTSGHRVPVTFFHQHRPIATRIVAFDGETGTAEFILDQEPHYAIPDYYRTLSDAVTDADTLITARRTVELPCSHFKLGMSSDPADTAFIHVAHHYCHPFERSATGYLNPGIVRFASRYWVISGHVPEGLNLKGYFRYARGSQVWSHLDDGLFRSAASVDSLRLLYRPDSQSPWEVVATTQTGNTAEGFLLSSRLPLGQYTLAIVDEQRLILPDVAPLSARLKVCPNPSHGDITLHLDEDIATFRVSLYDLQGRCLLSDKEVRNHQPLHLTLPKGTYLLKVNAAGAEEIASTKVIIQ